VPAVIYPASCIRSRAALSVLPGAAIYGHGVSCWQHLLPVRRRGPHVPDTTKALRQFDRWVPLQLFLSADMSGQLLLKS
jgi:hypothetical protein